VTTGEPAVVFRPAHGLELVRPVQRWLEQENWIFSQVLSPTDRDRDRKSQTRSIDADTDNGPP